MRRVCIYSILLILTLPDRINAQQNKDMLDQKVRIERTEGTILEFLRDLEKLENLSFSYDERNIPTKTVRVKPRKMSVKTLLELLFEGTGIRFRSLGKQIVIYPGESRKKTTLNGKIRSAADGEYLPGATVYIRELQAGVAANAYGFYSITVPPGEYTFVYSFIGYQTHEQTVNMVTNLSMDIELSESIERLDEIVVLAEKGNENIINTQVSRHSIEMQQIRSMPALGGEVDVLKGIQFLPGIQSANEGTTGFSVRGGSYDQNLILLDEALVYNPSHAVGIFSVFNPDVIKDVQVYKGGIPARYGGRLSSVIDIKMKEGNDKALAITGSVGVVGSRLTVESPIGKNVSVLLSGRYGYVGQTAKKFADWANVESYDQNAEVDFYDLNAKVNIKLSDKDHLYFSTYTGDDHFKNDVVFADNTLDWGNQTATVRWNRSFGPKLFGNLTFVYSDFDYAYIENNDIRNYRWTANFQQRGAKLDFDYFVSPKHELNFGFAVTDHDFAPGSIRPNNENSIIDPFDLDAKQAVESALYVSHEHRISPRFLARYGLRFSGFHNIGAGTKYYFDDDGENLLRTEEFGGGEVMNEYFRMAPRASLTYIIDDKNSVKASYNRTYQYLHLVTNSSVGLPTDVWLPVDNNIKPREADQVALGYFRNLKDNTLRFSAETYYKRFNNVIDYKDNADLFLNNNVETQIRTGTGEAYGIEFLLEKRKGRWNGWTSYTLSRVTQQIEGVNQGKEYAPRYDKRHNLSVVVSYDLNKKWQLAANYAYISGGGITVPLGFYNSAGRPYNYYSERNAYRLPAYHQLNISGTYKFRPKGRWKSELVLGITNVYDRRNYFSFYVNHQENARTRVFKSYLFGLMPSVNYNFKL